MIYLIYSHTLSFITRTDLPLNAWNDRLDRLHKVISYVDDKNMLDDLKFDYKLNDSVIKEISEIITRTDFKILRIRNKAFEGFKYEHNFLELKNLKGKLIYFKDWDFVFRKLNDEYYLWCNLGGIADLQREIKLSNEQIKKYNEIGLAQIDFMIDNIKKLNNSIEYENAIKENRRIV